MKSDVKQPRRRRRSARQVVAVNLPIDGGADKTSADDVDSAAAWDVFVSAGRRLEALFPPSAVGVDQLSEFRR